MTITLRAVKGSRLTLDEMDTNFTDLAGGAGLTGLSSTSDVLKGDALVGVKLNATGAVARTQHSKNADVVSVQDFGAIGDGVANDTVAMQAAHDAAAFVHYPEGTYLFGGISLRTGAGIIGDGRKRTVLNYNGSGKAIVSKTPGARTYGWYVQDLNLTDVGTGTVGIELDSVSQSHFMAVEVVGFTTGINVYSPTTGYSVYNRMRDVAASLCVTGFLINGAQSNENVFDSCRGNACTTAVTVTDSNHNIFHASAFESCTNALVFTATGAGLTVQNSVSLCRFENNTAAIDNGTNCSGLVMLLNYFTSNGGTITDNGTRTVFIQPYLHSLTLSSQIQSIPYSFERTANGGSEVVAFKVIDSNTSSGTPVTVQVETGRATGYFFRGVRAATNYFDIDAAGNIRQPVGSYLEGVERADPAAPAANAGRIYFRDTGGKTELVVRFNTGVIQQIAIEP